jgi:hypothetical protein
MDRRDDDELGPGRRIKLTALGKLRCPKLKNDTGIVVGKSPQSNAFRVLIDGREMPITLHETCIEAQ